jgi:hypothetical protein
LVEAERHDVSAGQTIILDGPRSRQEAKRLVDLAPLGAVLNVREAKRTLEQNDKLWAMLSDVSRAMPGGRRLTADVWKAVFMNACGHAVQFETGLSGEPFPIGFRSSRLSKSQMSELIEFILAWGTENGVQWSNEREGIAA